jgi:hypothetical protein
MDTNPLDSKEYMDMVNREEKIYREHLVWGYKDLPIDMRAAPDNRMPCPECGDIVKFYHTRWANQYGRKQSYLCVCGIRFWVMHDSAGSWLRK